MGLEQQSQTPLRSTLLDAVNVCLSAIGEAPVNSVDNPEIEDAKVALQIVLEAHREGQIKGWSWNRDTRTFQVDNTGGITVPENVIRLTPDRYEWGRRYQLRGVRVFDTEKNGYSLAPEISQLTGEVVELLPWDQCPEAYNRWATIRGARMFGGRILGSPDAVRFAALDEQSAMLELTTMEADHDRPNILTGRMSPFRTYDPARGIARRRLSGGWPL